MIHGIVCGGLVSNKFVFLGYDQYEIYCVGKVRITNNRGFVAFSCVVVVIFHRVAYCVVVFNLLVGTKVVASHEPEVWLHFIHQLEELYNNFGNWLNNDIAVVSRIQANTDVSRYEIIDLRLPKL